MMFLTNQELFIAFEMLTSEIYRRGLTLPDAHMDCYEKARMIL